MKSFSLPYFAFTIASFLLMACSSETPSDLLFDQNNETAPGYYLAPAEGPRVQDPLRQRLSEFFLVEQFNVGALPSMSAAFKANPPGGILFWNGNKADSTQVRDAIKIYSEQVESLGLQPLLFSTDYEGGADNLAPSGKTIPGVQRFVKGFTRLAHPRWLGLSMPSYGTELCRLHGRIMARELKAVGINYPLSVVSDLSTQALTSLRGISKNSADVSLCMSEIMKEFIDLQDLIFVTKHFPGLGLMHGDTHDGTVVSDITDPSILNDHLKPFFELIDLTKRSRNEGLLSIMTTHAKYLAYDPDHVTTESPKVVQNLLKQQMKFRGLVVSDAMWMGEYGSLDLAHLMPVYANSFLSGIDLLMIPGARFANSVAYFRKLYDGTLSEEEKTLLTARTSLSWPETHSRFLARVQESLQILSRARGSIQPAHRGLMDKVPTTLTEKERLRYAEILLQMRSPSLPAAKP